MYMHLTLVPYIGHAGELKTKPTQHSVNELRRIGIQPDMLLCRAESELDARHPQEDRAVRVAAGRRPSSPPSDVDNIYKVPLWYAEQDVDDFICEHFGIDDAPPADLDELARLMRRADARRADRPDRARRQVRRSSRTPTSRSPRRCATRASCTAAGSRSTGSTPRRSRATRPRSAACATPTASSSPVASAAAGSRARSARRGSPASAGIPYLGVCLGMQIAVCEFARHVAGMPGANSTEFDIETEWPVIDLLPEQKEVSDLGGTMRLGADPIKLHGGTRAREVYGEAVVYERHRHRYEVSISLRKRLEAAGPDRLGHVARRAARRDDRAAPTTRSSWPRSSTRSSSRAPSGPRRCSASSSPPRWSAPRTRARGRGPRLALGRGRGRARPSRGDAHARRVRAVERRRLNDTFAELCAIPPVSGTRQARDRGAGLRALGSRSRRTRRRGDRRGAGNVLARVRGTRTRARVLLCAHLDTVPHGDVPIEPVLVDGGWENASDTILGADNKAAVAVMLAVARRARGRAARRSASSCCSPSREENGAGRRQGVRRLPAAQPSSATSSTTPRRSARS